jgi:hypothetical protein
MKPASPSYLRTFEKKQTASPIFYKALYYNQLQFPSFWFSVLRQTENQSQANDFPFSAKRFFILSRTEKGVLQSLHPVPVSGKTIAKKGDGFARSHPLQVPEKISTVHSYETDFRLCLHTVQPSCDG